MINDPRMRQRPAGLPPPPQDPMFAPEEQQPAATPTAAGGEAGSGATPLPTPAPGSLRPETYPFAENRDAQYLAWLNADIKNWDHASGQAAHAAFEHQNMLTAQNMAPPPTGPGGMAPGPTGALGPPPVDESGMATGPTGPIGSDPSVPVLTGVKNALDPAGFTQIGPNAPQNVDRRNAQTPLFPQSPEGQLGAIQRKLKAGQAY